MSHLKLIRTNSKSPDKNYNLRLPHIANENLIIYLVKYGHMEYGNKFHGQRGKVCV